MQITTVIPPHTQQVLSESVDKNRKMRTLVHRWWECKMVELLWEMWQFLEKIIVISCCFQSFQFVSPQIVLKRLCFYPTWSLLYFFYMYIKIFHQIWEIFSHYLFKYFMHLSSSHLGLLLYICWYCWWCPKGHLSLSSFFKNFILSTDVILSQTV